ncbi:MAG: hypothetical protein M3436_15470 [Pseudomonadota bacterium]|nr:hypothetical protein [Pseudomonadota bacterium]
MTQEDAHTPVKPNGSTITILDQRISLGVTLRRSGFEDAFVALVGVKALHYDSARSLSKDAIINCAKALTAHADIPLKLADVVQMFVFTTQKDGDPSRIPLGKTHAFSVLTARRKQLEHHYYERRNKLNFKKYVPFSGSLIGPFDMDDIRLLHFARAGDRELPAYSTVYELNSGDWGYQKGKWQKNIPLRVALLRDRNRNKGGTTLGLYGNAVYRAIIGVDGTFCGGNRDCPKGSDSCSSAPGGPEMVCGIAAGGDVFVDWLREFERNHIAVTEPVDLRLLHDFRGRVVARVGRLANFVSAYYIAALFLKRDRNQLESYAAAVPHIQRAMRQLLRGPGSAIIVTDSLSDSLSEIVRVHRDVDNASFQRILKGLNARLKSWRNLTKRELLERVRD